MLFCLGSGRLVSKGKGFQKNNCIFNVQVTHEEWEKAINSLPIVKLKLNKYGYKEAWKEVWSKMSEGDKQKFLDLPHFNSKIFKEITGIDVKKSKDKMIKIKGKKYSEDTIAEALKEYTA